MSATPTRARGEYARTAQRKREIIDAAMQVFSEAGFRNGSLRDVAERAGITHAAIRHHYPTKNELLHAVLRARDEEALRRGSLRHPEGLEVLHEWLAALAHDVRTPVVIELQMTLLAEAIAPDHPAYEYFRDRYERALALLIRAFDTIKAGGQLVPGISVKDAARMVIAATEGVQLQWFMDRSIDIPALLKTHLELLLTAKLVPVGEQVQSAGVSGLE